LHEKHKTIIDFIYVFLWINAKLELWKRKLEMDKNGMFPTINAFLKDTEHIWLDDSIKSQISQRLSISAQWFCPILLLDITRDDLPFARNPYLFADVGTSRLRQCFVFYNCTGIPTDWSLNKVISLERWSVFQRSNLTSWGCQARQIGMKVLSTLSGNNAPVALYVPLLPVILCSTLRL